MFEGPFDLLLHLILREQVDLYEVSLADRRRLPAPSSSAMEQLDLEVATEFLLIAATLVELKTRRLLPGDDDLDLDDELALWEERDLLLARLLECKTFKDAAVALAAPGRRRRPARCPRVAGLEERFLDLTPDLLAGVTARRPPRRLPAGRHPQARSPDRPRPRGAHPGVGHRRRRRAARRAAPRRARSPSGRLTGGLVERLEVVVRFLAVLELFKQGLVDLDQPRTFGDIEIVWLGRDRSELEELAGVDAYDG